MHETQIIQFTNMPDLTSREGIIRVIMYLMTILKRRVSFKSSKRHKYFLKIFFEIVKAFFFQIFFDLM